MTNLEKTNQFVTKAKEKFPQFDYSKVEIFSNQEKKQMLPTLVDEEYDKVFLLSSEEIASSSYGFSSLTREKKPTDYAKANYAFSFIENGNGNY